MKQTKEIETRGSESASQQVSKEQMRANFAGFGKRKKPMVIEEHYGSGSLGIKIYAVFSRTALRAMLKAAEREGGVVVIDGHADLHGYEGADGALHCDFMDAWGKLRREGGEK